MTLRDVLVLLGSVAALGACTGEIYHESRIDPGEIVVTDARQRAIVTTDVHANYGEIPGQVRPKRIFCAEPSPDVAVTVANALGGSASVVDQVFGSGTTSISSSSVVGMAQLAERLATIQVLRDGLYKACEAYANGAISSATYAVIISGIDETLVTMLSSEMAAGAFGRNLAVLTGSSDAAARGAVSAMQADANAAMAAINRREQAADALEAKRAECNGIEAAEADAEEAAAADGAEPAATEDTKTLAQCQEEEQQAQRDFDQADEAMRGSLTTASNSAATVRGALDAGSIGAESDGDAASEAVRRIHQQFIEDPKGSSAVLGCMVMMEEFARGNADISAGTPAATLFRQCETILGNVAAAVVMKAQAEAASYATLEAKRIDAYTAYVNARAEACRKLPDGASAEDVKRECSVTLTMEP